VILKYYLERAGGRELRTTILNELFNGQDVNDSHDSNFFKEQKR